MLGKTEQVRATYDVGVHRPAQHSDCDAMNMKKFYGPIKPIYLHSRLQGKLFTPEVPLTHENWQRIQAYRGRDQQLKSEAP